MTPDTPSPTRSTSKANSYLLARRQGRRNQDAPSDTLGEEKGGTKESTFSTFSTDAEAPRDEAGESSLSPQDSGSARQQDPAEKAYKYLAQRRAKRRNRCLVSIQSHNLETAPAIPQPPPTPSAPKMEEPQRLVVLVSNGVSDRTQSSNQSRARTLLQSRGTPHVEVDGMDPNQKERCVTCYIGVNSTSGAAHFSTLLLPSDVTACLEFPEFERVILSFSSRKGMARRPS